MTLNAITRSKLNYSLQRQAELQKYLDEGKDTLSNEAQNFLSEEISKCFNNAKYYTEIIKILEVSNGRNKI